MSSEFQEEHEQLATRLGWLEEGIERAGTSVPLASDALEEIRAMGRMAAPHREVRLS